MSKGLYPNAAVASESLPVSNAQLWIGRVLTILAVLFLLFDTSGKLFVPAAVAQASARLGISIALDHLLGAVLLASTALYLFPRTCVLGAALLTGYLGGAVAIQIHAGSSLFETIFPILFAVVVWAGLVLRDGGVRAMFPIRQKPNRG